MKKNIYIILLTCVLLLQAPRAWAHTNPATLRISPVIVDVALSPGKLYSYEVKIENLSDKPMPVHIGFDTFETDEDGQTVAGSGSSDNSLVPWLNVNQSDAIIPAQTTKTVQVTISLPKKIPLGGYYGLMFVEPIPRTASDASQVSAKVGVLFMANVGVVEKNKQIELVQSYNDKSIYSQGPVLQTLRIKNNSLSHVTVKPRLEIKPWLGEKKVYWFEDKIIFPGKIRKWVQPFELPNYYQGFFRTTLIISTGNGHEQRYPGVIFALPVLSILLISLGLVLCIYILRNWKNVLKAIRVLFSGKS